MQKYNEVYQKLKPSEKAMEQLKEIPERNGKKTGEKMADSGGCTYGVDSGGKRGKLCDSQNLDEKKDIVSDENGNIIFEGFFNQGDDETFRRVWEEGYAACDMIYEIYLYTD